MCGGGGNYGQVASGIGGMFAAGGQQAGVGSVPAPTQSADTTSGIGQYMPMQDYNPMQQAANLYAPTQGMQPGQQFTAEQLYDPMAAAQARLASIPEREVMAVADLNVPVPAPEPVYVPDYGREMAYVRRQMQRERAERRRGDGGPGGSGGTGF